MRRNGSKKCSYEGKWPQSIHGEVWSLNEVRMSSALKDGTNKRCVNTREIDQIRKYTEDKWESSDKYEIKTIKIFSNIFNIV